MAAGSRRLAAIMFTDMVGYSALAQADEAAALEVLGRHNRLLRPVFEKFRGREVKTVGDAFLVEFDSALDATLCALEIQRVLREYNAAAVDRWQVRVRIGIHVGDVVETGGDVLGDVVNIASRIEPLAEPEGICISQQVYDQVQNKVAVPFVRMPPQDLKNIRVAVPIYRVGATVPARPGAAADRGASGGRHLAVLPLSNISPDPADSYFADGLTDELISVLSQVPGLSVIARTSVIPYKSNPKSIDQIATELKVDTVLEGSVRKSGNRIRITLQLIDVPTQGHIWSNSYNREIDDVFAVQADIADRTAEALRLDIARRSGMGTRRVPTENSQAYEMYLRGLADSVGFLVKDATDAARWFQRATELDPNFAEAYAAWGNLYVRMAGDFAPLREVMPRARELAARALALDPESSDAHSTLGNIALQFDHDWARSREEFERAIALNPNNVDAYRYYTLLLISLEEFARAREVAELNLRLDPGSQRYSPVAWIELEMGNFEPALRNLEAERDREPTRVLNHTVLGFAYLAAGRRAEAVREADTPLTDPDWDSRFDLALLNALVGRPEQARGVIADVEGGRGTGYTSDGYLAMLYAAIGEKDRALDLLEKDYREGDALLWLWYRGIFFDSLRDDPRFVALIRQYRLPYPPKINRPSRASGSSA